MTTLAHVLAAARATLEAAGITGTEAAVDADLFARTILGWDRATLLTRLREQPPTALEPRFGTWIARRARREPSSYIVGIREFWGLDFHVSADVLVPRPETEFIVEESVAVLRGRARPRLADIGTGSGIIAVSLAVEIPDARVVATDISGTALVVAAGNAARHGAAARMAFVQTSYLDGVAGSFDLIAANPPYVKDGDKPALTPDVRHEPEVAIFGGADGLRNVAGVLDTAASRLRPGGWLVMEFGYGQEDDVRALVERRPGLRVDHVRADLQGIARTAIIEQAGDGRQ